MGYREMAQDAGYRGDEARQIAEQLEYADQMEAMRMQEAQEAQQREMDEIEWQEHRYQFLLTRLRDMAEKWREGDFDLPPYVKGKMDGCHQCADELLALIGDNDTGTGGAG